MESDSLSRLPLLLFVVTVAQKHDALGDDGTTSGAAGLSGDWRAKRLERLRETLLADCLTFPSSFQSGDVDGQIALEAATTQQSSEMVAKVSYGRADGLS